MKSDVRTFVIFMLLLQVVSTALLWILNVLSVETSGVFAVLLAANLIAFATVVHVYRNPGETDAGGPEKESQIATASARTAAPVPSQAHQVPPKQSA